MAKKLKYTKAEAYAALRENVYPPCSKSPGSIVLSDILTSQAGLGFTAGSVKLLASKTNNEFGFTAPDFFKTDFFEPNTNVMEHLARVLALLSKAGRLT